MIMRFIIILFIQVFALGGAEKPGHIIKDPQAKKIIVIRDELLQKKYGAQLAAYMQALRPAEAINGKGQMRIRSGSGRRETVAVQFKSFAVGVAMVNQYITSRGTLTISQQMGQATQYRWQESGKKEVLIKVTDANISFAGSDFLMVDLGLEMLRWPNQNMVERKLRRGELCSVLVSRPGKEAQGAYSKVISWVDEDSMGIVRAELYDSKNKLFKIFEPKSFKKINGQWHLKEMEMRNDQLNSRTSIVFDLDKSSNSN
tara:strand:+ start:5680 stop:6453 length:774 start_codon:yes stop_codon:yes gene_type:complete